MRREVNQAVCQKMRAGCAWTEGGLGASWVPPTSATGPWGQGPACAQKVQGVERRCWPWVLGDLLASGRETCNSTVSILQWGFEVMLCTAE